MTEASRFPPGRAISPTWRRRVRTWTGILGAYFGSQSVTQLLGILAGLIFVRTMAVREFALYTLASSVLTFFTFMTDLGSTTSLLHFFHRTRSTEGEFRRYLLAVFSLRRLAFVVGALAVAALFPVVAFTKGFDRAEVILSTAAVLAAVGLQIVSTIRLLVLRLDDRYAQSYRAEMSGAALRLLLAAAMVVFALLQSWLGLAVAAAGAALTALLARDPTRAEQPGDQMIDLRPYRRAIIRYLLPTLPGALYYAVQGPLLIWLAATFGATRNIAEVGALGRLGLVIGIFSGLTGVVFLPRLARLTDERLFRARTLQFGAVHLFIATTMLAAASVVPDFFLWILGQHYSGLHRELLLVVAAAGISLLDGYLVSVNLARSWTRFQVVAVATVVIGDLLLVMTLHLDTTLGILTFNAASAVVALVSQLCITAAGFFNPSLVLWKATATAAPELVA